MNSSISDNKCNIGVEKGQMNKFMDGRMHKSLLMDSMKAFLKKKNCKPNMVVVQVGLDIASSIYIKHKMKACQELGIGFHHLCFEENISEQRLVHELVLLNENKDVHGYIVQLPLPQHINVEKIVMTVDPNKDIDCFHPENVGRLLSNVVRFAPPTPLGIIHLLKKYGVDLRGKHIVIIGKSRIVGTPLALMLSNEVSNGATVTMCDKWTEGIDEYTRNADVLIVSAGVRELIKREAQIAKDAVLIDVGIHRVFIDENGEGNREGNREENRQKSKIVGDIAKTDEIIQKCGMMSPSPGGCGCLTVAYLCVNVIKAYMNQNDMTDMIRTGKTDGFCQDSDIIGT